MAKIHVLNLIIGKERQKYVPVLRTMMTEKRSIVFSCL